MEIWKDIPGYNGIYQVSNLGRVRTHNKTTYTEKHGVRHWKDRVLSYKPSTNSKQKSKQGMGYRVDLWKDGKPHTFLVARLVAFNFFNEDINNHELTVNHKDGNRLNNNLTNLELVPLKENIQHAFRNGFIGTNKKIKIIDKITGTVIYPSSLSEGSRIIGHKETYLSALINKNKWQNDKYMWSLI